MHALAIIYLAFVVATIGAAAAGGVNSKVAYVLRGVGGWLALALGLVVALS